MKIEAFADRHRAAVGAIAAAIFPEYADPDAWAAGRQFDDPDQAAASYAMVDAGSVIGYGALRQTAPDRYRVNLMVDPARRGRGAGTALWHRLASDLVRLDAVAANLRVRTDQSAGLRFAAARGFVEVHQMRGMRLMIAGARLESGLAALDALTESGIALTTLDAVRHAPDGLDRLCRLHNAALDQWPNPDPTCPSAPFSREDFATLIDDLVDDPSGVFIAVAVDECVGYGGQLGTAVHPDYRGRGVATALKTRYVQWARDGGLASLYSCSANPAIVAINAKLGYRTERVEVRFIRRMEDRQ